MIRINLQKNLSSHKKSTPAKGKKWLIPVGISALVTGAVVLAILIYPKHSDTILDEKATVLSTDMKPSTHYKPDMIEDVVGDIDGGGGKKLFIPYEEMSATEKISYEILFAKSMLALLDRIMSNEIRLVTLNTDEFRTIQAKGFAGSKSVISEMLKSAKTENIDILPSPHTSIKKHKKLGYQFVLSFEPQFQFESNDPIKVLSGIPFRDELGYTIKEFSAVASENGVRLNDTPKQVASFKAGSYRKFLYRAEGESTYKDFVRFVLSLDRRNVSCAFRNVEMTASGGGRIRLGMDVLFIIKES